jgi:hypothetical protein
LGVDLIRLIDEIDWSSMQHNYGCAENIPAHLNGLYKAEVIWQRGPWRSLEAVEFLGLMASGTRIAEDREIELLPPLEDAVQQSYPVVMIFLGVRTSTYRKRRPLPRSSMSRRAVSHITCPYSRPVSGHRHESAETNASTG